MARGGDRRPLVPAQDRDLVLAALLLAAMRDDPSAAGGHFREDERGLFDRWRRLIRVLTVGQAEGCLEGHPLPVYQIPGWRERVSVGHPAVYPRPQPLSADVWDEVRRRHTIATDRQRRYYTHLGFPTDSSDPATFYGRFSPVCERLTAWANEPARQVNPTRRRFSRRQRVSRYFHEVAAFCDRWRLRAWWAVPFFVETHIRRVLLPGAAGNLWPGDLIVGRVRETTHVPIAARLPGAADAEVARDRVRWSKIRIEMNLGDESRGVRVLRLPSRRQRELLEHKAGATVVVVDWDGSRACPECGPQCHDPDHRDDLAGYLISEVERRIRRSLTARERRSIRHEIDQQVDEARADFRSAGWHVSGGADLGRHARWLARRLLNPDATYWSIASDEDDGTDAFPHLDFIRHACRAFATRVELVLLPQRRSR